MSLSVSESSAVNVLLQEMYRTRYEADGRPSRARVNEAAKLLATSAHKRLMAGVDASDVTPQKRRPRSCE